MEVLLLEQCKGQRENKLEENAGSVGFWKCVRSIGLANKGRPRFNLEEVYDKQGEIKTLV